ncbi:protein Hook homolog 3-like isoform X2 [Anneissia japonica]|uniref:protein Hook homolog 3-like isoform X2 n=1 Tax=Anneissia japonica TaxID=1529436 RepID=UPI001425B7B4|nr:protein Hook homolog 3-like isoform X2 [Anneissia japonica]
MMAHHDLCSSLIAWVGTFELNARHVKVDDLADGVAIAEILQQCVPTEFDDEWFKRIKRDASGNWRIKHSNLKKVLERITDYYNDVLNQSIQDFPVPDLGSIAELGNEYHLGRLLQLVLGIAVNCDRKEEYINSIMGMEEDVQQVIMGAIQEIMNMDVHHHDQTDGFEDLEETKYLENETRRLREEKDLALQKCHELDLQVAALQEEKNIVQIENESLLQRMEQGYHLDDPSSVAGRKFHQLQQQVEQLQEENFRVEGIKDDFRIKAEMLDKEVSELTRKNDELTVIAEEAQHMKDEMDILRHSTAKLAKYEASIDTYKKKLEDLADLRKQIKLLEEKNTSYMKNTIDLEEELKKANALKTQLETYKRQTQELHIKLSEVTKKADKLEFEAGRQGDKTAQLQAENERLRIERDSLKETNDELTCTQLYGSASMMHNSPGSPELSTSPGFTEMVPPEIREKMIRLQHENKMLKLQQTDSLDEKSQLLQSLLDDSNSRKNELESDNRFANQRILELEAELEELKEQQREQGISKSENNDLKLKIEEQKEKLIEADTELQVKREYIDHLEPKVTSNVDKMKLMQSQLVKKEQDMKAMEERYKKYLEKAKAVIRTLDPKHNPGSAPEIQALKNQLQEKQRTIELLESEKERSKVTRDNEEKLIVSAWYNMGMNLHRKAAEDRLIHSGGGQSFLARQRQASQKRSQSITGSNSMNR